jgi:hypothetical protein
LDDTPVWGSQAYPPGVLVRDTGSQHGVHTRFGQLGCFNLAVYCNTEYLSSLDNEVGQLIRFMPSVDTSLLLLMADAYPERGWAELSLNSNSPRAAKNRPTHSSYLNEI